MCITGLLDGADDIFAPYRLPVLHTTPLSHMPSPLPRRNRWVRTSFSFPNGGGLPPDEDGSASALPFSRPAQRSLHVAAYTLAESLTDPFTPECFSRFVTSTTVPIATGWNDPCRVGFAPTEVVHLCTAHYIITARRMTSGELLKYRKGLFITADYESLFPGSSRSRFTLTVPSFLHTHTHSTIAFRRASLASE